jgi:hypothetical protein
MRELERDVDKIVKKGWRVERVIYDDEEGYDFYATVKLSTNSSEEKDGVQ